MDKDKLIWLVLYLAIMVGAIVLTWGVGKLFSDAVSDHKVITPEPDVKCIIVSRMFNTSVDCWED